VLSKQSSSPPLQLAISSRGARRSPLPPGFIAASVEPNAVVGAPNDHAIAVVVDLVHPRRATLALLRRGRRGFNWADRYPRIVEALHSLRVRSIVIDGEAVWCGNIAGRKRSNEDSQFT
jgi:hypothetical protein